MARKKKSYIQKITPFIDRMRSNYEPEDEGGDTPVPPVPPVPPEPEPVIDPTTHSINNVEVDLQNNSIIVNQVDLQNHTIIL